ncbi:MAG TPA: RNase adapter RapZ [Acetobacteraceae bacterium]|nr:RNase adapter RapZ [Acetobacteraceae bacterium]
MSGPRHRVVLVTGLSGAGKASVLRALEDLGYEAVDNPPLGMLEALVGQRCGAGGARLAIGVDARTSGFDAEEVLATRQRLIANPALLPELIYATADEAVLLRRYTETRRRHPLAVTGRVSDGVAAETALTAPLLASADLVIDTSDLPLPALRRLIEQHFADARSGAPAPTDLTVSLLSFAYPGGLPREADLVFDCRFLRNPHYDPVLRPQTGRDPAVVAHIQADPDYAAFTERLIALLALVLPRFVQEGKKYATIAFGCTGGRHRSVHLAETIATHLASPAGGGWRVTLTHRELVRGAARQETTDRATARADGVVALPPESGPGRPAPPVQAQEA